MLFEAVKAASRITPPGGGGCERPGRLQDGFYELRRVHRREGTEVYSLSVGASDVLVAVRLVAVTREVGRHRLDVAVAGELGRLPGRELQQRFALHALVEVRTVGGRVRHQSCQG